MGRLQKAGKSEYLPYHNYIKFKRFRVKGSELNTKQE